MQERVRGVGRDEISSDGARTLDIAKRLIDYGYHLYDQFLLPRLFVEEGMFGSSPTETELVETLDAFADAIIAIAAETDSSLQWSPAPLTTRLSGASMRPRLPASRTCAGGRVRGAETSVSRLKSTLRTSRTNVC